MPYVIIVNQLQGLELILRGLRKRAKDEGCLASLDLAAGIEAHALYQDPTTGKYTKLADMNPEPDPEDRPAGLRVVK